MQIDCRAFLVPGPKPAIVVATKQGLLAQGKGEEELVPVGAGILQENGPPNILFGAGLGQKFIPSDPNQAYRTRVIFLVDKSSSMAYGEKFKLVQDKINALSTGLKDKDIDDIDYTLIFYDTSTKPWVQTKKPNELIGLIQKMSPGGGTDIANAIKEGRSVVEHDLQNQARNIIVLITDGQHEAGPVEDVFREARKLIRVDCSAYLVGVGADYDLDLMRNVLQLAKFGGLTHLPQPIAEKRMFLAILSQSLLHR